MEPWSVTDILMAIGLIVLFIFVIFCIVGIFYNAKIEWDEQKRRKESQREYKDRYDSW